MSEKYLNRCLGYGIISSIILGILSLIILLIHYLIVLLFPGEYVNIAFILGIILVGIFGIASEKR